MTTSLQIGEQVHVEAYGEPRHGTLTAIDTRQHPIHMVVACHETGRPMYVSGGQVFFARPESCQGCIEAAA